MATVHEIYDQSIKRLDADERLHLARLILDDLAPDAPTERPGEVRDRVQLEALLVAGLHSGPLIAADADYWARKQQHVTALGAGNTNP